MNFISTFKFKKTSKLKSKKAYKPKKAVKSLSSKPKAAKATTKKAKTPKKKRKFSLFQLRAYWMGVGAALSKKKLNEANKDSNSVLSTGILFGSDATASALAAGYKKGKKYDDRDIISLTESNKGDFRDRRTEDVAERMEKYPYHNKV